MQWRKELSRPPKRLVIKFGSSAVTRPEGGIDLDKVKKLSHDLYRLWQEGCHPIVVCSGAIQTARALVSQAGKDLPSLQALSAVGQSQVIAAFATEFAVWQIPVAQLLLTHEDFSHGERYHNLSNTLQQLLQWRCLPIINENDSIAFEEITVGDNDQLAARIAENCEAELLVMLTESRGLFDRHPQEVGAKHLPFIDYDQDLQLVQTINKSIAGRGGMKTKLEAVRKLTPLGIPVIVADYRIDSPLLNALENAQSSSFFAAAPQRLNKRKARLLTSVKEKAWVRIDKGARLALESNKSLLPVGITHLGGRFRRGDTIKILHQTKIVAHGVAEYSSTDLRRFLHAKAQGKEKELLLPSKVFVHKNHLQLKS